MRAAGITAMSTVRMRRLPEGANPLGRGKWLRLKQVVASNAAVSNAHLVAKAKIYSERDQLTLSRAASEEEATADGSIHAILGDAELHSEEAWRQRLQLRKDPAVLERLNSWWEVVRRTCIPRDELAQRKGEVQIDRLRRRDYVDTLLKMYKALIKDAPFDEQDARRCAEEAWEHDCAGSQKGMERSAFMDGLFEMIDLWTLGVTRDEYTSFASVMLSAVAGGDPPVLKSLAEIEAVDVAVEAHRQAAATVAAREKEEARARKQQEALERKIAEKARRDEERREKKQAEQAEVRVRALMAGGMSREEAERAEAARRVEAELMASGAFQSMSVAEQMEARVQALMASGMSREEAERRAAVLATGARVHALMASGLTREEAEWQARAEDAEARLEARVAALIASGMSPHDAQKLAREEHAAEMAAEARVQALMACGLTREDAERRAAAEEGARKQQQQLETEGVRRRPRALLPVREVKNPLLVSRAHMLSPRRAARSLLLILRDDDSATSPVRYQWRERLLPWEEPTPPPVLSACGSSPRHFYQTSADRDVRRLRGSGAFEVGEGGIPRDLFSGKARAPTSRRKPTTPRMPRYLPRMAQLPCAVAAGNHVEDDTAATEAQRAAEEAEAAEAALKSARSKLGAAIRSVGLIKMLQEKADEAAEARAVAEFKATTEAEGFRDPFREPGSVWWPHR